MRAKLPTTTDLIFLSNAMSSTDANSKSQAFEPLSRNARFDAPERNTKRSPRLTSIINRDSRRTQGTTRGSSSREIVSDMKIGNRSASSMTCTLSHVHEHQLVSPPVLFNTGDSDTATSNSSSRYCCDTRVMQTAYLYAETIIKSFKSTRKLLNHTAQASCLRLQSRGSLLLRQPRKQASKSRLPTLKHSLESRASKPVKESKESATTI